jgi:hypothetical protein
MRRISRKNSPQVHLAEDYRFQALAAQCVPIRRSAQPLPRQPRRDRSIADRALIVEDEIYFTINLEADMHALGFDICDLAANGQ